MKTIVANPNVEEFDIKLETYLETTFQLSEAIVCNCDQPRCGAVLGAVARDILMRSIVDGQSVGLSWGRSVAAMVESVPSDDSKKDLTIIALSGGVGSTQHNYLGNTLVLKLAERLHAHALPLEAPAIVQHDEAYTSLVHEPAIARVLKRACEVDVAVVGIGVVGIFSTLTTLEYLDPKSVDYLKREGAVGDICSRFYRFDGDLVQSDIDDRTIGITLTDLKKIPRVIGIGWGMEKVDALLGALRMGVLDVLVTDRDTAAQMRDRQNEGQPMRNYVPG